jgi:hypothetical protein
MTEPRKQLIRPMKWVAMDPQSPVQNKNQISKGSEYHDLYRCNRPDVGQLSTSRMKMVAQNGMFQ